MTFTVVIPARYASQRLPGKPLADIGGKPMIERVYHGARQSAAERVIVATDDQRIYDVVLSFGGECCMTRDDHESGTDRLQEVAAQLGMSSHDIIVNVQGDEPLIPAAVINQVAENLRGAHDASAATLCEPINELRHAFDPNVVKVVADANNHAMYFSRASIPWARDEYGQSPPVMAQQHLMKRHIGIYAYRVELLNTFVQWHTAPLETIERLEQLRILYNGHKIHVADACTEVPGGIDTQADLLRVNKLFVT